jgi:LmbE family N-acetylglucosaminyl deacetylase
MDEELSFAGTIIKLLEKHEVTYLAISSCGSEDLKNEWNRSCEIMSITKKLTTSIKVREFDAKKQDIANFMHLIRDDFDFVFTHSEKCRHDDHKTVGEQSKRIFNGNLLTYIQPWNAPEDANYFVELSESQLQKKIDALKCYKSQSHRTYMSEDFIRSWAVYNGIRCGKKYAEAFQIQKLINIGT